MTRFGRLRCVALLGLWLHTCGCPLLIAGAAGGGAAGAAAAAQEGREDEHSAVTYVATVLANVVYFPAKVVVAGLGAATTGVAYVITVGDSKTSNSIWTSTVDGDYVLTPSMIEGRKPVHFIGS